MVDAKQLGEIAFVPDVDGIIQPGAKRVQARGTIPGSAGAVAVDFDLPPAVNVAYLLTIALVSANSDPGGSGASLSTAAVARDVNGDLVNEVNPLIYSTRGIPPITPTAVDVADDTVSVTLTNGPAPVGAFDVTITVTQLDAGELGVNIAAGA